MEETLDSEEGEESPDLLAPRGTRQEVAPCRPIFWVFLRFWSQASELSKSVGPGSQMYPLKQAPARSSVPNSCHTGWGRGKLPREGV